MSQPSHRNAGQLTGLGVGECQDFLTSIRHRLDPFVGCSDAKRGPAAIGGSKVMRSQLHRESRPRVDAAAVAAGRDPAEIVSVYNFGGRITP